MASTSTRSRFADAVDDRTLAIATSHVFFTTGAIQDLAAIADIARRAGAYSLIDGYQGAGQVAVDLPATGEGGAGQSPLLQHGGRCGRVRGGAQRDSVRRARLGRTLWIERQLRNVVPVDSAPRNTRRIVRCGRAVYEDDQGRSQQIEPHRTVTHLDCTDVPCSCVEIEIRRVTLDTCRQGPQSAPVVEAEAWPVPNLGPAPVLFDLRLGGLNPPSDPFRSLDVGVNFLRASKLLHVRGTWVHCGVVNPITSAIDQIGGEEAVPRNFAGIHIDFSLV